MNCLQLYRLRAASAGGLGIRTPGRCAASRSRPGPRSLSADRGKTNIQIAHRRCHGPSLDVGRLATLHL